VTRWDLRGGVRTAAKVPTFTVDELAARWGEDLAMGREFVRDFLAAGYLESVNGNGRVRPTEKAARLFGEVVA
jgi:hypothetical protein